MAIHLQQIGSTIQQLLRQLYKYFSPKSEIQERLISYINRYKSSIKYKYQMSEVQQNWKSLFKTILQAEISSSEILPQSIVLLGMTRGGKSTTYDWLIDCNSLVGIKQGINKYFDLRDKQNPETNARIGHTMLSVTELPNKKAIKVQGKQVMLIDFPGFGDRKGATDVIKINYCMCSHLLKLQNTKFVIVIPERVYGEIASTGVRDALNQFLNLFDFKVMEEQEQMELFSSVSICITSSTEADEVALLQQLDILNKNLKELYEKNPGWMDKYLQCEKLLIDIKKGKRIVTFPRAVIGQSPKPPRLIQDLNAKGWKYAKLTKDIKNALHYPYATQYHLLTESEQEKFVELITGRFQTMKLVQESIRSILQQVAKQITNLSINFTQQFQLISEFNALHDYMNLGNSQSKIDPKKRLSLAGRVKALREIFQINQKIVHYSLSEEAQQNGQEFSNKIKQNEEDSDPIIKYYRQSLTKQFSNQIDLIQSIIQLNEGNRRQLRLARKIVQKILDEAIIFQHLNRGLVHKDSELGHELRNTLKERVSLGNFFISSEEKLDELFVEEIYKSINNDEGNQHQDYQLSSESKFTAQLSLSQCDQLVAEILDIKKKEAQTNLNTVTVYFIIYNLHLRKANLYGTVNQQGRLQALAQGLFYTIKMQVCLQCLDDATNLRKLLIVQKNILKELLFFYLLNRQGPKAVGICESLDQKRLKLQVLMRMHQMDRRNNDLVRQIAQYCRQIGESDKAIAFYRDYQKRTKVNYQGVIKQIIDQYSNSSLRQSKIQNQGRYRSIDPQSFLQILNQFIATFIPNKKTLIFDIPAQRQQYCRRNKNTYAVQSLQRYLQNNPESYELLAYCDKLAPIIKEKSITVLLSPNHKTGQTTLAYSIAGFPLRVNLSQQILCYDLLAVANNRINNPTEYPMVLPLRQDQLLIDYVNIFGKPPLSLAAIIGLQKLLIESKSFRFMLVIRDEDISEAQAQELIKMLAFFINVLGIDDDKSPLVQNLAGVLHITLSFSQSAFAQNDRRKKLKSIAERLNDNTMVAQNERRYFLSKGQQHVCSKLLKKLLGKIFMFQKPTRLNQRYQKRPAVMEQGSLLPSDDKWVYLPDGEAFKYMTNNVVKTQLQGEIEMLVFAIRSKREILYQIYRQICQFAKSRIQQFIHRQEPSQQYFLKDFIGKLYLRQVQSTDQIPQDQIIRELTIIKQIFVIKQILAKISSTDYNLFYQQQSNFFEDLNILGAAIFDCSKMLCQPQAALIESWKQATTGLVQECKALTQKLSECQRQQLRYELFQTRRLHDQVIPDYDDKFTQLVTPFTTLNLIKQIESIQSLQDKEHALSIYKQILDYIVYPKEMKFQAFQRKVQLANAQIEVYSELNRTQDLVRVQCSLIDLHLQHIKPQSRIEQNSEIIYILEQIAGEIRGQHPRVALSIGEFLGDKQIMAYGFKYLQENEKGINKKVEYLIILIDLSIQLRQKPTTTNMLHRRLLEYVANNPQAQAMFRTPAAVQNHRRSRIPIPQPRDPTAQEKKEFMKKLKKDLDL